MQRSTFTIPALVLGLIANTYSNAIEASSYAPFLLAGYFVLMVFGEIDNPLWYVLYSMALTALQVIAQVSSQMGAGSIFYLCIMILLYVVLALNILIAVLLLHYHRKEVLRVRSAVRGRWSIITLPDDREREHVSPCTVVTFNDNHTGSCIDFYGMESFTYRVNPKLGTDTWPYIKFTDRKNGISLKLDYQLPGDYNSNLRLGEEYAFEDDFRGYIDENGVVNLIVEPTYDFRRTK